jgi:3-hydroxyacyl-CoA dehydrogenase
VGSGAFGGALATAALANGLRVTLLERTPDSAARARDAIADRIDTDILHGRINPAAREALLDQALTIAATPDALAHCDMVVESVPEDADLKRRIFETLGQACPAEIVLASATATLDLGALADAAGAPERVLGLHAFAPAPEMQLFEIVGADNTAPEAVAAAFALVNRLGRTAVRARARPGYIGNRIMAQCRAVADKMVLEGASPYQIDTALCDFGLARGPFERADMLGLTHLAAPDCATADVYAGLRANGWLGRAAGRGFYRYDTGDPDGLPDPEVEMLVARARHDAGVAPRRLTDNEVIRRHIAALVNEAARVLAEGVARRPLDIDMTFVHGGGFPRWRGGPLHYADRAGLANILADIHRYAQTDPEFWQAAPLLTELVEGKKTFAMLNRIQE